MSGSIPDVPIGDARLPDSNHPSARAARMFAPFSWSRLNLRFDNAQPDNRDGSRSLEGPNAKDPVRDSRFRRSRVSSRTGRLSVASDPAAFVAEQDSVLKVQDCLV